MNDDYKMLTFVEFSETSNVTRIRAMYTLGQIALLSVVRMMGPALPLSPWLLLLSMIGVVEWKERVSLALINTIDPISAKKLAPLFAISQTEVVTDRRHPAYPLFESAGHDGVPVRATI